MARLYPISGRPFLPLLAIATAALIALSANRDGRGADPPSKARFEFHQQEILADSLAQTLGDLDAQGWETVQIVPVWKLQQKDDETTLSPRSYQVIAKRRKEVK